MRSLIIKIDIRVRSLWTGCLPDHFAHIPTIRGGSERQKQPRRNTARHSSRFPGVPAIIRCCLLADCDRRLCRAVVASEDQGR